MIQVTFIFTFLTIFFFVYVQEVEKEEFRNQLNLIVDTVAHDLNSDLSNLVNKSVLNAEDTVVLMNGLLDLLQEKIAINAKSSVSEIEEQNRSVKMSALKSLTTVTIIVVIAAVVILLIGFCFPIIGQVKEALLVIIFIGLTEFMFLQIIAKRYISADPNKVKRSFAQAIQSWIRNKKKLV